MRRTDVDVERIAGAALGDATTSTRPQDGNYTGIKRTATPIAIRDEDEGVTPSAGDWPEPFGRIEGLTLADLQDIGREVGISPEAVAQAAQSLELRRQAVTRSFLGLPIGVERTVTLNRWLTDARWDQLVVQLRETFRARGTVSPMGPSGNGAMDTSRLSWNRLRTDTASSSER